MKKLSFIATAAALMFGLPAYALADNTCENGALFPPSLTDLVLGDGTDIGHIHFTCAGDNLNVTIHTEANGFDYVVLSSIVSLGSVGFIPQDCKDPAQAFINKPLNPQLGKFDLTSALTHSERSRG